MRQRRGWRPETWSGLATGGLPQPHGNALRALSWEPQSQQTQPVPLRQDERRHRHPGAVSARASSPIGAETRGGHPALAAVVWARPGGPSMEDRHPAGGAGPRPEADLPEVTGLCEDRPLPPARAGDPASHPNPCREAERATRASPLCTRCQPLSLLGSDPHLQSALTVLPPHRRRRTRPSANGCQPDNTTAVTARSRRIADGRGTPRPTGQGSALETQRPGPGLWERGHVPQAAVGSLTFLEKRLSSANDRYELDKMMLHTLV